MERILLTNEISKLILRQNTDIRKIISEVNRFDSMLKDTLRNFYELKMDDSIPLFALCEYLKYGAANYELTSEECDQVIDDLTEAVQKMFGISLFIRR